MGGTSSMVKKDIYERDVIYAGTAPDGFRVRSTHPTRHVIYDEKGHLWGATSSMRAGQRRMQNRSLQSSRWATSSMDIDVIYTRKPRRGPGYFANRRTRTSCMTQGEAE